MRKVGIVSYLSMKLKYDQRPGMMDNEFQKYFRLFLSVFQAHFSSTAERLDFGVIDVQKTSTKIFILFGLRINKFYENGPL